LALPRVGQPLPKVDELIYKPPMRNMRPLGLLTVSSALISAWFLSAVGCADGELKQAVDSAALPPVVSRHGDSPVASVPGTPGTVPVVTSAPLYEMSGKPKVVA
jgi:hypothetical protein